MKLKMFNMKNVHTDQDYIEHLQVKSSLAACFIVLGGILGATYSFATRQGLVHLSDYFQGFYAGASGSLIVLGLVLPLRNRRLMKQPEVIKKMRIRDSDERNQELSAKALRIACIFQLAMAYLMILVGPFFNELLVGIGTLLIFIFIFAYLGTYVILKKWY
ncbi:DUF6442 family protein [Enterococcus sp. LJL120]